MPVKPIDKDAPTDEQIAGVAAEAIVLLREMFPVSYRVRNIIVKKRLHKAVAELQPVPEADGGPVADITISRAALGKNWRETIYTRIFHEWMELALYGQSAAISANACPALVRATEDICETASVVMESAGRKIFALLYDDKPAS